MPSPCHVPNSERKEKSAGTAAPIEKGNNFLQMGNIFQNTEVSVFFHAKSKVIVVIQTINHTHLKGLKQHLFYWYLLMPTVCKINTSLQHHIPQTNCLKKLFQIANDF